MKKPDLIVRKSVEAFRLKNPSHAFSDANEESVPEEHSTLSLTMQLNRNSMKIKPILNILKKNH